MLGRITSTPWLRRLLSARADMRAGCPASSTGPLCTRVTRFLQGVLPSHSVGPSCDGRPAATDNQTYASHCLAPHARGHHQRWHSIGHMRSLQSSFMQQPPTPCHAGQVSL